MSDYRERHTAAIANPSPVEEPFVLMMQGISRYVEHAERQYGTPWRDYVLGEGIGTMLTGFRDLLNGELGRLDGGTLDAWLWTMAKRIGYDLNTDKYVG